MIFHDYRMPWPLEIAVKLYAISDVLIDKRDKMDMWEDKEIIDNAIVDVDKVAKRLVRLINSGEKEE